MWKINKLIIKFIMGIKIAKNIQDNIEEDDKIGGLTLSDIRVFYKSALCYIVEYWPKDRQIANRK